MAEEPQNQERQEQLRSQASNDLGRALNQQRELNQAGAEFVTVLREIAEAQKQAADAAAQAAANSSRANIYATAQAAQQKYIADQTKNSVSLASQLSKFSREDLKSKSKRRAFESTYTKALDSQKLLIKEAEKIREEAAYIPGDLKELELDKARALEAQVESSIDLFKQAEKLKRTYSLIGRLQKPFEGIEKIVSSIPVVRELFGELTKMSQKIADTYNETANGWKSFGAGVKQLGKGLLQLTLGAFITGLIRGFSRLSDSVARVQNGLALTTDQATKLSSTLSRYKTGLFTLEQMENAAIGFGTALGSSSVAAGSTYRRVAALAERLGISAEESAKIYSSSVDSLMSFERQTNIIGGTVEKLNEQSRISIRLTDIYRDIAGASGDTLLILNKFPNGVAKAAFEARKLGLNLNQIKGIQEALLDFQSSITAELNAEAIIGKEFNLDRAKYFAYKDDLVNLSKEIYNLTGGIEGYLQMDYYDRSAMAEMFKMTSDQYGDMIMKRAALLKIAEDEKLVGFDMLSQEQQIEALIKKYTGKDFNLSVEDARIKALETLQLTEQAQGAKIFKQQENALGAMNKLSISLEDFGLKIAQMVTVLFNVKNPLDSLATGINSLVSKLDYALTSFGIDLGYQKFKLDEEKYKKESSRYTDEELRGFGISKKEYGSLLKIAGQKISLVTSGEKRNEILEARQAIEKYKEELTAKGIVPTEKEIQRRIEASKKQSELISKNMSTLNKVGNVLAGVYSGIGVSANVAMPGLGDVALGYGTKIATAVGESIQKKLQKSEEYQNFLLEEGERAPEYTVKPKDTAQEVKANDFTIRTHPKDTLKIAGGTKFGDETNQLLEKLIDTVNNSETNKLLQVLVDTVKQGGNVYLDRRKVGESLVLGYSSQ